MKVMVYLGKKVFQLQQLWSAEGSYVSVFASKLQAGFRGNRGQLFYYKSLSFDLLDYKKEEHMSFD